MSRRNAVRHGLTAETVIDGLEDIEDYRGFEAAIISDYETSLSGAPPLSSIIIWKRFQIIPQ
jgi:hypothetical protein